VDMLDGCIRRCPDPGEVRWRLYQLQTGKFGWRLVRSDRLTSVVHKHHIMLPLLEGVSGLFSPECVVRPADSTQRALISSLRTRELVTATQATFRILKEVQWRYLFSGRDPPEIGRLDPQRAFGSVRTPIPDGGLILSRFRDHWANPGFKFQNDEPFWIRGMDNNPCSSLAHTKWAFGAINLHAGYQFHEELVEESLVRGRDFQAVLSALLTRTPVPNRVRGRIPLFFESDNYILQTLDVNKRGQDILLVSLDRRLGDQISRIMGDARVALVDPLIYLVGRMDEIPFIPRRGGWDRPFPTQPTYTIVDEGACWYADTNYFLEGEFTGADEDHPLMAPVTYSRYPSERFRTLFRYHFGKCRW